MLDRSTSVAEALELDVVAVHVGKLEVPISNAVASILFGQELGFIHVQLVD